MSNILNYKSFYSFYLQFNCVEEIVKTPEWKEFYCYLYHFDKNELSINPQETICHINEYDSERQKQEIEKCSIDFSYFCHKYIKVGLNKESFITYNFQKRIIDFCVKNERSLIQKPRCMGITTLYSIWTLWKCMFKKDQKISFINRNNQEKNRLISIIMSFIDFLPKWISPKIIVNNKKIKFIENNSEIHFFSIHEINKIENSTHLIVDETNFIQKYDEEELLCFLDEISSKSCEISMISTIDFDRKVNYNWFYFCRKKYNFKIEKVEKYECPLYANISWIENKKRQLKNKEDEQRILFINYKFDDYYKGNLNNFND